MTKDFCIGLIFQIQVFTKINIYHRTIASTPANAILIKIDKNGTFFKKTLLIFNSSREFSITSWCSKKVFSTVNVSRKVNCLYRLAKDI